MAITREPVDVAVVVESLEVVLVETTLLGDKKRSYLPTYAKAEGIVTLDGNRATWEVTLDDAPLLGATVVVPLDRVTIPGVTEDQNRVYYEGRRRVMNLRFG